MISILSVVIFLNSDVFNQNKKKKKETTIRSEALNGPANNDSVTAFI